MKKIAIPVAGGALCQHFGHCEQFVVMDLDDTGAVITKQELTPPPHEPGVLPVWLHSLGVEHVIAGGMGAGAQAIFQKNGISVTVGAAAGAPETLAAAYIRGTLADGENRCDH